LFIGAVERQMLLECFLYSVIGLVVVLHFFLQGVPSPSPHGRGVGALRVCPPGSTLILVGRRGAHHGGA
jgi:hypothetical protein